MSSPNLKAPKRHNDTGVFEIPKRIAIKMKHRRQMLISNYPLPGRNLCTYICPPKTWVVFERCYLEAYTNFQVGQAYTHTK